MNAKRSLLLTAAALVALASPVRAEDFLVRCSSGALRTCASFQVLTVPLANGGTQVFLRARNEGVLATGGATWGSLLTNFALITPGSLGTVTMQNVVDGRGTIFTEDGATVTGNAAAQWQTSANLLFNQIDFLATTLGNDRGGIQSCVPANGPPSAYFSTCADGAPSGWVTFAFTTSSAFDASQAQIAWAVQAVGDGNQRNGNEGNLALLGTTGYPTATPMVTPEPATLFLLGSGMMGLAGVVLRRNKRRDEEDELG